MGFEDAGNIFLSKSGKAVMVKIDNEKVCRFKVYLTAYIQDVQDVIDHKKLNANLKLINAEKIKVIK